MKFKVLGSNSNGNCYILDNGKEVLIIEAGVNIVEIQQALSFDFSNVKGCIVSHLHGDHSKCIKDLLNLGIDVYSSPQTFEGLGIYHYNAKGIRPKVKYKIGGFTIKPFDVEHDAPEPFGFYIQHEDMGLMFFITDTKYCKYKLPNNVRHYVVESNYSDEIIKNKLSSKTFLMDRVYNSHLSLENCIGLLQKNDLSMAKEIVLIHLSDSNSDEKQFVEEVIKATGKTTYAATKGLELDFSINN